MFRRFLRPSVLRRAQRPTTTGPRPRTRLSLENLEDRYLPSTVTITALQGPDTLSADVPAATEGALASPALNASFTDTNAVAPANLRVTINYGDGTPASTNQGAGADPNLVITQVGGAGGTTYTITDQHTFPEESGSTVPPFAFTVTLTVTENANAANTDTRTGTAQVLDASLVNGDPVTPVIASVTTGGNTGSLINAATAETQFEAAIGGVKNTAPAPQNGGFRVINWDAVKTDGTDAVAGPNSTVPIPAGSTHTVGIPLDRFQGQGVFFGAMYAVSNDGFVDLNPSVGAPNPVLFPAFTAPSTFAMFNDNGIDFKFVAPSATNTGLVSAASRGFGAIFLNVQHAGSTTIQYFHGAQLLDTLTVPTNATPGAAVFAGELFNEPIVTNVLLTLGDGVIFKFDGTTVTAGAPNSATNNLVAVDDWVFPEPVPTTNGFAITSGPAGTLNAPVLSTFPVGRAFTGLVGNFSDLDPQGTAKDYTATINWGDGHLTNGTIKPDGKGGFAVFGTNTYASAGLFPVSVDVFDFGGGPGPGGSNPSIAVTNTIQVLDANHSFVKALFNDFLKRDGSAADLDAWVSQLPTLGQAGVANAISHSTEALDVAVVGFYQKFLGRTPQGGEQNGFVSELAAGATEEQVIAQIVSSNEFANRANALVGGANADTNFVQALYLLVLNRTGGTAEVDGWVSLLPSIGRSGVAAALLASTEARGDAIALLYGSGLLDRSLAPSAAEVNGWVNSGLDLLTIQTQFASTTEYLADG
jgi:hypothetical protein